MKTKFSVLMSVYDKEKASNLEECLDSIFNQTVKPNQVVVVLDGKLNEKLLNVLKKYKLDLVKLNEHNGLIKALNIGLTKCKYNLVARMDSDDICMPNRFELLLDEFKKDKNLVLVGGQIVEFDENGLKKKRIVPTNKKQIHKFSKKRNPFNHMTVMYKKDIILSLGGYPNTNYFEDYHLWTKVLRKNYNVKNIEDIVVKARSDENHIRRRGGLKYVKYIRKFELELYKDEYISLKELIVNIFERTFTSILPNRLRQVFYNNFLRK